MNTATTTTTQTISRADRVSRLLTERELAERKLDEEWAWDANSNLVYNPWIGLSAAERRAAYCNAYHIYE